MQQDHPLWRAAAEWRVLTDVELARLRFSLMRELAWIDWDGRPVWWWQHVYTELLAVKLATGIPPRVVDSYVAHGGQEG